jgi:hypothetical protein
MSQGAVFDPAGRWTCEVCERRFERIVKVGTNRFCSNDCSNEQRRRQARGWSLVDGVIQLQLSQGLIALVSPEDSPLLSGFSWAVSGKLPRLYAYRSIRENGKKGVIYLHRLVARATDGDVVDHINGNTLDDRRENLRLCNHAENLRNRGPQSGRAFKGIRPSGSRWSASIQINRRRIQLGVFDTEIEAAQVYDDAAAKYFGEFAWFNFPERQESCEQAEIIIRLAAKMRERGR